MFCCSFSGFTLALTRKCRESWCRTKSRSASWCPEEGKTPLNRPTFSCPYTFFSWEIVTFIPLFNTPSVSLSHTQHLGRPNSQVRGQNRTGVNYLNKMVRWSTINSNKYDVIKLNVNSQLICFSHNTIPYCTNRHAIVILSSDKSTLSPQWCWSRTPIDTDVPQTGWWVVIQITIQATNIDTRKCVYCKMMSLTSEPILNPNFFCLFPQCALSYSLEQMCKYNFTTFKHKDYERENQSIS